jgi:hypothetical protein
MIGFVRGSAKKDFPSSQVEYSPLKHIGIFISGTEYHITGETPQNIDIFKSSAESFIKSYRISYKININETTIPSSEEVIRFVEEWQVKYPVYTLWQDKFAKDFSMHFFAYKLITQVDELVQLGWRIIYFGVIVAVLGVLIVLAGGTTVIIYAKHRHHPNNCS